MAQQRKTFAFSALGVLPTETASKDRLREVTGGEFERSARTVLPPIAELVRTEVLPHLGTTPGVWHPTGFMVFSLGTHQTLGNLRLHIWPRGIRHREPKGRGKLPLIFDGDIHDHAWHVGSLVLAGYRDFLFDVAHAVRMNGALPDDTFRVFTVEYGANAHNALTTDGTCLRAEIANAREFVRGDFHFIPPGVFHAPTIPDDQLGATLVFSSARILPDGPHVLVGGSTEPIVGHRQAISADDAAIAAGQLLDDA